MNKVMVYIDAILILLFAIYCFAKPYLALSGEMQLIISLVYSAYVIIRIIIFTIVNKNRR